VRRLRGAGVAARAGLGLLGPRSGITRRFGRHPCGIRGAAEMRGGVPGLVGGDGMIPVQNARNRALCQPPTKPGCPPASHRGNRSTLTRQLTRQQGHRPRQGRAATSPARAAHHTPARPRRVRPTRNRTRLRGPPTETPPTARPTPHRRCPRPRARNTTPAQARSDSTGPHPRHRNSRQRARIRVVQS